MARWQRLYHEVIAPVFDRGLYWRRFATLSEKIGEFVYLFVYLAGIERRKFRTARGAMWPPGKIRAESHHSEGRLDQAWKT